MRQLLSAIAAVLAAASIAPDVARACSRVLWNDNGVAIMVGRTMDWLEDTRTNLWVFPRGIARSGLAGDNSIAWTSKYGSVTASAYDISTTSGLNEKGLIAEALWLADSDYGKRDPKVPGLSLALWMQYMLDNFATVAEAVTATKRRDFQVVPVSFKVAGSEIAANIHLALADASGDSAIIEIVNQGAVRIYHDRTYTVMTNEPPFPEQLKNLQHYQGFGGNAPLPGTSEPADRFVRAAYYLQDLPKPTNLRQAVAGILSVMRNVSHPFGKSYRGRPNVAHTIWRSVADATNRIYFFESTLSPNVVWVQLDDLDLQSGTPVRKLDLVRSDDLVGDVTTSFKPSPSMVFQPAAR